MPLLFRKRGRRSKPAPAAGPSAAPSATPTGGQASPRAADPATLSTGNGGVGVGLAGVWDLPNLNGEALMRQITPSLPLPRDPSPL